MDTPAQYRKFAEECERLAQHARGAHHRQVLEEMAQVWKELANGADGKHQRSPASDPSLRADGSGPKGPAR